MSNVTPNRRSAGRLPLPSRASTPSSTATESDSSPRSTPLTPHDTLSNSVDADGLDLSTVSFSPLDHEHLSDFSDSLVEHAQPSESDDNGDQEEIDDISFDDTRSEPLPNISACSSRTVIHSRANEHHSSSSAPSRPRKSAFSHSPPPARSTDSGCARKKRARFDENALEEDVLFQRASTESVPLRRQSTPARSQLTRHLLARNCSFERSTLLESSEDETKQVQELAAALGVFEEVVEELMQIAEEHEVAQEQFASVCREVAEAIIESREEEYEGDDEDDNDRPPVVNRERRELSGSISQCSADEDVDETCTEANPVELEEFDDEAVDKHPESDETVQHEQSEVLFRTEDGKRKAPDLAPIAEEPNSSGETVKALEKAHIYLSSQRRVSEQQVQPLNAMGLEGIRRNTSTTDFIRMKRRIKLQPVSSKADPAPCAVTACSVRASEAPKQDTVYAHPGARVRLSSPDRQCTMTAQMLRADSGTFQVLWQEPPPSGSSGAVTLLERPTVGAQQCASEFDGPVTRASSPMDKVKTKLAAWSWARERGLTNEHGKPKWLPLLAIEEDDTSHCTPSIHTPQSEDPVAPPNTERPSGASSARHSAPRSPPGEAEIAADPEDDEEDQPIELKVRAKFSRLPSAPSLFPPSDYLDVPTQQSHSTPSSPGGTRHTIAISRQLSNLAAEETHFQTHRDSVILTKRHKHDEERTNQQLMNSHDSIILTRPKFDTRYPKAVSDSRHTSSRVRDLSPLPDASPPDARRQSGLSAMLKIADSPASREQKVGKGGHADAHPEEHEGCPIYEVEQPRWFEANCKKGVFI